MHADRKTAIVVGVLFILATVLSLVSTALTGSVTQTPLDLANIAAHANQVILGALAEVAAAISVVLIPATLFPVLRRQNEGTALGYFGFRILEALTQVFDAISALLLVSLSQHFVSTGAPTAASVQAAGIVLQAAHNWAFPLDPVVFGPGALLLYVLLYQARLVPRWLSAWGLLGAVLVFVEGLLAIFGNTLIILAIPIAVQEMVLAIWLIVRGFDSSARASQPATHELGMVGEPSARRLDPIPEQ